MIQELGHNAILVGISGINVGALAVVSAVVWRDGRWKGKIEATLEALCKRIDRLERTIANGQRQRRPPGSE